MEIKLSVSSLSWLKKPLNGVIKEMLNRRVQRMLPDYYESTLNIQEAFDGNFPIFYFEYTDRQKDFSDGRYKLEGIGYSEPYQMTFTMSMHQKTSSGKNAILRTISSMEIKEREVYDWDFMYNNVQCSYAEALAIAEKAAIERFPEYKELILEKKNTHFAERHGGGERETIIREYIIEYKVIDKYKASSDGYTRETEKGTENYDMSEYKDSITVILNNACEVVDVNRNKGISYGTFRTLCKRK